MRNRLLATLSIVLLALAITGCGSTASQEQVAPTAPTTQDATPVAADQLKVIATTTIVGDVVRNVGGEAIDLTVLLPIGADPHGFEPAPADIAAVNSADLVFINGLELEHFLEPLLENAGGGAPIIAVSDGITPIDGTEEHEEDTSHADEDDHGGNDPHTWTDPNNVMVWVDNIQQTLSQLDPANEQSYAANATAYKAELQTLDGWIRGQVSRVSEDNRKLVTDHAVFGYFANQYGFEQTGAVIPGYSTLSEPSAQDVARLEDTLRSFGVRAIFVGNTINEALAQRVADDLAIQLVQIYTGSLSAADGPAASYLDYMRYNTEAIVNALQ
ncbi:MAG: zinc ABC transporter substrate-binding protein [Caldilineae bacterium]|nr:zinc ABC transporter substrate-binding protein [Caldilineae bacterium]